MNVIENSKKYSCPIAQIRCRALHGGIIQLLKTQTIAPVISTPGCGTPFVELVDRSSSPAEASEGECEFAGKKIRAQTGCPAFGTGSSGSQHCTEQRFFVCENSGLQGIADSQGALFYGEAEQAQYGENCQEVELVSECV